MNPALVRMSENGERPHTELHSFNSMTSPSTHSPPRSRNQPTLALDVTVSPSTLGLILVAQSDAGVSAILMGDDRNELLHDLQSRFPNARLVPSDDSVNTVVSEVIHCIESPSVELRAALDMHGSDFQVQVWTALRAIPAGTTSSYTDIAIRIGRPRSVRAVAQACAANPLAVVVPCHRVLRRDGQLSGYRWGIHRKRELLARESMT